MPKFNKLIVTEGLHVTADPSTGKRNTTPITKERLTGYVDNFNRMRANGIRVPAPESHIREAKPEEGVGGWSTTEFGSKSNYGFWEKLEVVDHELDNGQVVKALFGTVDVPNEDDAARVGTSVVETSIFEDKTPFIDGKGQVYDGALSHIALVTKPIEANQPNFEPVESGYQIAMSQMTSMSMPNEGTLNFYDLLEQVAGIKIPNTSPDQLMDVLTIALNQKRLDNNNREGGTVLNPPGNARQQQAIPVFMSNNTNTQTQVTPASTIQSQQVPNQSQEQTPVQSAQPQVQTQQFVDPMAQTPQQPQVQTQPAIQMSQEIQFLKSQINEQKKTELRQRVASLVNKGVLDVESVKPYDEAINGVQMSFDAQNQPVPTHVEAQITALEGVAKNIAPQSNQLNQLGGTVAMATPNGTQIEPLNMQSNNSEATDETMDAVVNRLFPDAQKS